MSSFETIQSVLLNPDSCGLSLTVALDELADGSHAAWEFDTLWMYLDDKKCLPGEDARDRIMAVTASRLNPAFLWDGFVFANLVCTLNGKECAPEIVERASIGELLWALYELREMYSHYHGASQPFDFGDEPAVYAAAICANEGISLIPSELDFCKDALKMMPSAGTEDEISAKVIELLKKGVFVLDEDSAAHVQARKLQEASTYVDSQKKSLHVALDSLR